MTHTSLVGVTSLRRSKCRPTTTCHPVWLSHASHNHSCVKSRWAGKVPAAVSHESPAGISASSYYASATSMPNAVEVAITPPLETAFRHDLQAFPF